MTSKIFHFHCFVLCALLLAETAQLFAQSTTFDVTAVAKSRDRGVNFLKTKQAEDGSWTSGDSLGVSGIVTYSLLVSGVPATDPVADRALKYLLKHIQADGGIYAPKSNHKNYETSICLLALSATNHDGKYSEMIKKADHFIRGLQWDESESTPISDVKYGGSGYGRNGDRPDLSNTVFFLDALKAAGAKSDDPAVQKALVFLSRCQNLETPHNNTPFASKINDGGFYYTPAAGGSSPGGTTPEGGLRSYGSMTYAELKSMVYAGVKADDPRVKAATDWIRKFYTVQENPGLGSQGVYYYYLMFAKTMQALEVDQFTDSQGNAHDWRRELVNQVLSQQQENGAWLSKNDRWYEGNPDLVTAYVLITLKHCETKTAKAAN